MISYFEFIDKKPDGTKERVLGTTIYLYNKLSADETNAIRAKLNELVDAANFSVVPLYEEFALKFKGAGNTDMLTIEVGDIASRYSATDGIWENAVFNGGDPQDPASYTKIDLSPDQTTYVISSNGYQKTGLHRKFFANWEWQIKGVYFTNPAAFEFDITLSAAGLQKFWLVVLTDIGFELIPGAESTIPQTPNIPIDNIVVSTILITDSGVVESTPPVTETNFPKRQFTADGVQTTFDLTTSVLAKAVFLNGALLDDADWSQTANILTLTFTPAIGQIIKPI